MSTAKNQAIRAALEKSCDALTSAHSRILEARRRDAGLCAGFRRYDGVGPELKTANELLNKHSYRVALAGMMSAGKSTLANAILRRPGLLPTGIDETTLTITEVTPPPDGREGLEVEYLTYAEALQGVFQRGSYAEHVEKTLGADVLAEARKPSTSPDTQRSLLEKLLAEATDLNDTVRDQLEGFLEQLEEKKNAGVLGKTVYPEIGERRQFLAPRNMRDVGHLLLIAEAGIRIENELFSRDGLSFVDLPGVDSTNERQHRIAFRYLEETDLLIAALEAAGLRKGHLDILDQFRRARGDIRERVFFVVNKFDSANPSELSLQYFKNIVDYIGRDFDVGNLFFTVGLWSQLEQRRTRGDDLSPEDDGAYKSMKEGTTRLVDHLEAEGILKAVEERWEGRIGSRLVAALRGLRDEGGVAHLRNELIHYLKDHLERQRLKEIYDHLVSASGIVEDVMGPERSKVQSVLDSARQQMRAAGEYLEQVEYDTRDVLRNAHAELAKKEGGTEEFQFQMMLRGMSEKFQAIIGQVVARDNPKLDFRQIAENTRIKSAENIMQGCIDTARSVLSDLFLDFVREGLASEIARRYTEALKGRDNETILEEFGKVIQRPDLKARYEVSIEQLVQKMKLVTATRALEETWEVDALNFSPSVGHKPWEEVEPGFREAISQELQRVYGECFKSLAKVLLKYYKFVIDDFIKGFEEITAQAQKEARQQGASVPAELLLANAPPEKRRQFAIAELVTAADEVKSTVSAATAEMA